MKYRTILRPGAVDEMTQDGLADGDALDEWLMRHGRRGDRFRYETYDPVAASGDGTIDDLGEPAYRLDR